MKALLDAAGNKIRCTKHIGRPWSGGNCYRNASVMRAYPNALHNEERPYCTQHDPLRIEEKRAATRAESVARTLRNRQEYEERLAAFADRIVHCKSWMDASDLAREIRRDL